MPTGPLTVRTTHSDAETAALVVHGVLSAATAPMLRCIVDDHRRAGRRFIRVNCTLLRVAPDGLDSLLRLHQLLLNAHGTLILTNVSDVLRTELRRGGVADVLFLIAPTAADAPAAPGVVTQVS
jgi:anti-anti-sigma regulatory factor